MSLLRFVLTVSIGFLMVASSGCDSPNETKPADTSSLHESLRPKLTNKVAAVAYPLQYFTQRIAGDHLNVEFPVGHSPSQPNWQPPASAITVLQDADLIITNGPGAEYADWLSRVSLSPSKLVKSCINFASNDFVMVKDHKIVHQHGPEGEHSHPYMVAYSWLDPFVAEKQAKQILQRMCQTYPEWKDDFEANFATLQTDFHQLQSLLKESPEPQNAIVLSINPQFKFLTRSAKIEDRHFLWFEKESAVAKSEEPTVPRKVEFTERLNSIRESSPDSQVVLLIPSDGEFGLEESLGANYEDEFNLNVVRLNTLDQKPDSGDYVQAMKANIERLQNSVR